MERRQKFPSPVASDGAVSPGSHPASPSPSARCHGSGNIDVGAARPPLPSRRHPWTASLPHMNTTIDTSAAVRRANEFPSLALGNLPSPMEEAHRLRAALGAVARIFVKRDDAIPFGFGGNK